MLINTKQSVIGLDISDHNLKLVQLKPIKNSFKIQAIGKYRLHEGVIVDGEIKNQAELAKAIKNLLSDPTYGSINTNSVSACLPDSKTFIKLIAVNKGPNKIGQIIESEIEKHVPMGAKEMYFDWQIIDSNNEDHTILVGAAPRNIVDQYVSVLKDAKLSVSAMEIEATAVARALLAEESSHYNGPHNKNYCLIDIGARHTSLTIYAKNTIALSVSLPISGEDVTDKIAETLEIKRSQAEKAKIICGLDRDQAQGIIYDILMSMANNLNLKISETLDFFSNHYPSYGPINEIILCGGGANIKNLEQEISQSSGLPAKMADPFTHISNIFDKSIKNLTESNNASAEDRKKQAIILKQNIGIAYTTAIGLALRPYFV